MDAHDILLHRRIGHDKCIIVCRRRTLAFLAQYPDDTIIFILDLDVFADRVFGIE